MGCPRASPPSPVKNGPSAPHARRFRGSPSAPGQLICSGSSTASKGSATSTASASPPRPSPIAHRPWRRCQRGHAELADPGVDGRNLARTLPATASPGWAERDCGAPQSADVAPRAEASRPSARLARPQAVYQRPRSITFIADAGMPRVATGQDSSPHAARAAGGGQTHGLAGFGRLANAAT